MRAIDYFLKIDGIPGESQDSEHKDEIVLQSFSWGDDNPADVTGGRSGKPHIHDFVFSKRMDKASPVLFLSSCAGKHLKTAVLTARRAGGQAHDFLVIKLNDVVVSSYVMQTPTEEDDVPVEQVAFSFSQIVVEYRPQRQDGSLDAPVHAGWDVKAGKSI